MLSGSMYATQNVSLLRFELENILAPSSSDSRILSLLKGNMKLKFGARFPVDMVSVAGALMDPRLRDLVVVDRYLQHESKSKRDFLIEMIDRHGNGSSDSVGSSSIPATSISGRTEVSESAHSGTLKRKFCFTDLARKHSVSASNILSGAGEVDSFLSILPDTVGDESLDFGRNAALTFQVLQTLRVLF